MTFLNLPINQFFINLFITFFTFFFIYIKIPKNLSAKYYQENKERLQKKARERDQNLSKKKNKSDNMVMNITKTSQKMKSQKL